MAGSATSTFRILPALLALLVGAGGGVAFAQLGLPLPWMLGALTATLVAAVAGVRLHLPMAIRPPVIVVIGVLLGSGFTPDLLAQAGGWAVSLLAMAVYLAVAAAVVVPFYARVGGFDRVTAYFAGMPGGLTEMVTLGAEAGGDERRIILAHAARIVVTVAAVAFWFRLVQGYEVSGRPGGAPLHDMAWRDIALLAACGVAGALAGSWLRLPAATLLGPMLLSGLAHVTGLTASAPPGGLVVVAQVVLGTAMGCRFVGVGAREVGRALVLSAGATALTLAVGLGFALALQAFLGFRADQVLLAFAPGGLTEMGLIALAIEAEVAFVALHHVARIVLVIVMAPLVLRLFRR